MIDQIKWTKNDQGDMDATINGWHLHVCDYMIPTVSATGPDEVEVSFWRDRVTVAGARDLVYIPIAVVTELLRVRDLLARGEYPEVAQ